MHTDGPTGRDRLRQIARRAMIERGLEPDFPPEAVREASRAIALRSAAAIAWTTSGGCSGRRSTTTTPATSTSSPSPSRSPAAACACSSRSPTSMPPSTPGRRSTRTRGPTPPPCYTPAAIFPMLPERLSTDLTSLGEGEDRLALVVVDDGDGRRQRSSSPSVSRALVRNHAKLAYNGVAAWLDGRSPAPPALGAVPGLDAQIRLQDRVASAMSTLRHRHGAIQFHSSDATPGVRRRPPGGPAARRPEPCEGTDRRLHDRGQHRRGGIPGIAGAPLDPPRAQGPDPLGSHRGARGGVSASGSPTSRTPRRSRPCWRPGSGWIPSTSPTCRSRS